MLVELVDVYPNSSVAGNFLWRYRERGSLRVNSATWVESPKARILGDCPQGYTVLVQMNINNILKGLSRP